MLLSMATRTLTDLELRILAFEKEWEGRRGSKEAAIRSAFGWRVAAYEQRLQAVLREPAAEAAEALLVHRAVARRERLRERRDARLVG